MPSACPFVVLQLCRADTLSAQVELSSYFIQLHEFLAPCCLAMRCLGLLLQDLEGAAFAGGLHQFGALFLDERLGEAHLLSLFPRLSFEATTVVSQQIHEAGIDSTSGGTLGGDLRLAVRVQTLQLASFRLTGANYLAERSLAHIFETLLDI